MSCNDPCSNKCKPKKDCKKLTCKKILKKILKQLDSCKCDKDVTNIQPEDINKASQFNMSGYLITKPGIYRLCGDVNWSVPTGMSYAISIQSQNVTLDLRGHFIKQNNTTLAQNFAIQVASNASMVLIQNGIFQNISGGAILIQPGASCIGIDHNVASNCCYAGATTTNGTVSGAWASDVLINGTSSSQVSDVAVNDWKSCSCGIIGAFPQYATVASVSGNTLNLVPMASFTGSINVPPGNNGTLSVTGLTTPLAAFYPGAFPRLYVGQQIAGAGVPVNTFITAYRDFNEPGGSGYQGGNGLYMLSTNPAALAATTMTAGPLEPILPGYLVTGTGITPGTTIAAINSSDPNNFTLSAAQGPVTPGTVVVISDPNARFISGPTGNVSVVFAGWAKEVAIENIQAQSSFGFTNNYDISLYNSKSLYINQCVLQGLRSFGLTKGLYYNEIEDLISENLNVSDLVMYVTGPNLNGTVTPPGPGVTPAKVGGNGSEGIKCFAGNNIVVRKSNFAGLYTKTQVPAGLPTPIGTGSPPSGNYYFGSVGITMIFGTQDFVCHDCDFVDIFNDNGMLASVPSRSPPPATLPVPGRAAIVTLENCFHNRFLRITGSNIGGSGGVVYGFGEENFPGINVLATTNRDNIFQQCRVAHVSMFGNGYQCAGFRLIGTNDAVEESNIDYVKDFTASGTGYGILLDTAQAGGSPAPPLSAATKCMIKKNEVANCSGNGLQDLTTLATTLNVLAGNIASYNASGVNGNYYGAAPPAWVSIINWQVGTSPPGATVNAALDNQNIYQ